MGDALPIVIEPPELGGDTGQVLDPTTLEQQADEIGGVLADAAAAEVLEVFGRPIAPPSIKVRNPSFDVTPAELISAIITERGVARPPYRDSLAALGRGMSVDTPAGLD